MCTCVTAEHRHKLVWSPRLVFGLVMKWYACTVAKLLLCLPQAHVTGLREKKKKKKKEARGREALIAHRWPSRHDVHTSFSRAAISDHRFPFRSTCFAKHFP